MYTLDYFLRVFEKEHVVRRTIEYFRKLYSIIADYAVPQLLESLALVPISQKFKTVRLRKHVLLYWPPGWLKSTLLQHFALFSNFTGIKTSLESSFSEAVVRGSAYNDTFVPPIALQDLVVIPELNVSAIRDEIMQIFLSALENDVVTVRLVKLANVIANPRVREEIEDMGIEVVPPAAIRYSPRMTVWAGTHTLETINADLREAILSRFTVVEIPPNELRDHLLNIYDGLLKRDSEYEKELAKSLSKIIYSANLEEKDIVTLHSWVREYVSNLLDQGYYLSPRDVTELFKTSIAVSVLMGGSPAPKDAVITSLERITRFMRRDTLEDQVMELLSKEGPLTRSEIAQKLGISTTKAFRILKRIGARSEKKTITYEDKDGKVKVRTQWVWYLP